MWHDVKSFWVEQGSWAKRVLKLLDDRFEPQVFLVGLHHEPSAGFPRSWVVPQDDFWIAAESFEQVLHNSLLAFQASYDPDIRISNAAAQERRDYSLLCLAIRDATRQAILQHSDNDQSLEYHVSVPVNVSGYMVSTVIGLEADVLRSHYSLERGRLVLWEYRETFVARSLVEAAIWELFLRGADELKKPDFGYPSGLSKDPEEVVRAAGRQLVYDIAVRVDEQALEGWHNLFRACTMISSLKYEQAAGVGRMVIARKGHSAVQPLISFATDLRLEELRGARKLLELASTGPVLHTDSMAVFGLGTVGPYTSADEDLFEVSFLEHHHWELSHSGQVLMRVKYGTPYLPKAPTYLQKLPQDLRRIFKDMPLEVDLLVSLVRQAEQESHGTMLLITSAAESEARRLSAQGSAIEPVILTPDLLKSLTRIDGAVILDPSGRCHAIGVILDGMASDLGDSSRGARYNSALRYVNSRYSTTPCLAIVVSVDGGVSLVPDLRPRLRRSAIDETLARLISSVDEGKISWHRYHSALEWLSENRFYLRREDCDRINQAITVFKDRVRREEPMRPTIGYGEFEANPSLDEDFYYE